MRHFEEPEGYKVTGGLLWFNSWGLPITVSIPMAEMVLIDDKILIRSMGWDKFSFLKDEIEVKEMCSFFTGLSLRFLHQKKEYPKYIVFGFSVLGNKRAVCSEKLESIGVRILG